ncbi:MAG TPA: hypothetical protein G4O03_01670 [Dehalococcoidia bacterium]|jgi:hypothetical protein|nr:hypothetical protein [Dehalococcoidia bacterium]
MRGLEFDPTERATLAAIMAIGIVAILCLLLWRGPILGLVYLILSVIPSPRSTFLGEAGFIVQVAAMLIAMLLISGLAIVLLAEGMVRLLKFGGKLLTHHR